MFLEVMENKIVSVNALELQKTSTFYLLPQSEQLRIHQEVNDITSEWVKENGGEENLTQEECDAKMTENFIKKFEEEGITEVDVIMVNGAPTYIYDNMEDAQAAYEIFRTAMMEGQPFMVLWSEYLMSKSPKKEGE